MTAYDDVTPHDIGMAVLGRLAAMVAMRHAGPVTSLSYVPVDGLSADALVADFVALSSGHGEHHRPGSKDRLHDLGKAVLRDAMKQDGAA